MKSLGEWERLGGLAAMGRTEPLLAADDNAEWTVAEQQCDEVAFVVRVPANLVQCFGEQAEAELFAQAQVVGRVDESCSLSVACSACVWFDCDADGLLDIGKIRIPEEVGSGGGVN